MQGSARVEGEHPLREPHSGAGPPLKTVSVDGLCLGDARVIHEREPDPEGILRQQRRHGLPCLAFRLHLTPKDLLDTPSSSASNAIRRGPGDGVRPSSAISLSPARLVAALRTNVTRIPSITQSAAMIGYHAVASV